MKISWLFMEQGIWSTRVLLFLLVNLFFFRKNLVPWERHHGGPIIEVFRWRRADVWARTVEQPLRAVGRCRSWQRLVPWKEWVRYSRCRISSCWSFLNFLAYFFLEHVLVLNTGHIVGYNVWIQFSNVYNICEQGHDIYTELIDWFNSHIQS